MAWGYALVPYVRSKGFTGPDSLWTNLFRHLYHCPKDTRKNGLELRQERISGTLRRGNRGTTWSQISQIPRPVATVLYAEKAGGSMADHFMAHFWVEGASPRWTGSGTIRNQTTSIVTGTPPNSGSTETFSLTNNIDHWNPATAR